MSEHTPTISMASSAHYTTRQSLFDNRVLGRLTDADIRRYEKQGFYGKVIPQTKKRKRRSPTVSKTKKLLDSLFA